MEFAGKGTRDNDEEEAAEGGEEDEVAMGRARARKGKASKPAAPVDDPYRWETGSSSDFGSFGAMGRRDFSGGAGYGSSSAVGGDSDSAAEGGGAGRGANGSSSGLQQHPRALVIPGASGRPPRPPGGGSSTPGTPGEQQQPLTHVTRRVPKLPMVRLEGKWYRGKTVRVRLLLLDPCPRDHAPPPPPFFDSSSNAPLISPS